MSEPTALERFNAMFESPAVEHLRGRVIALDVEAGTSEMEFYPRPEFLNPWGNVQGGFVTAMLDSAAGIAGIAASNLTHFVPTLDIRTSFFAPAFPGRLIARGRCIRFGRSVAFLEADLFDADERLLARVSVTSKPVPREKSHPLTPPGPA